MLTEMHKVLFLLLIVVVLHIDCKSGPTPKRSKAYLNAFRNIPRLFDYLLETLDERPEILEKNNADVFKRSIEEEDGGASVSNVYVFKRSIEDENHVTDFGIQNDENDFNDESYEEDEPENGDILDYVESDDDDKSGEDDNEFDNMVAYSGLQFESFTTLTSDEVAENALKVEKMLEEQNNKK
ncbi:hypothetical protein NE865_11611 [Phthorimaea operculella]|nr:hypothetical protein NE865_11611 [Phthorimaea operculella]